MDEPLIFLKPITRENWLEAAQLGVKNLQSQFLSPNLISIAQSKFEPERVALAIYNQDNIMVGFVMYNDKPLDDGTFRISRLMIGSEYQGLGYGKAAAVDVLSRLKNVDGCTEIVVEVSKENKSVIKTCEGFGFKIFGEDRLSVLAKLTLE